MSCVTDVTVIFHFGLFFLSVMIVKDYLSTNKCAYIQWYYYIHTNIFLNIFQTAFNNIPKLTVKRNRKLRLQ